MKLECPIISVIFKAPLKNKNKTKIKYVLEVYGL